MFSEITIKKQMFSEISLTTSKQTKIKSPQKQDLLVDYKGTWDSLG